MLSFAEQTGSGAVMIVWSFLTFRKSNKNINHDELMNAMKLILGK